MLQLGVVGALAGMLMGELISVVGIVLLATRRPAPQIMPTRPADRVGA